MNDIREPAVAGMFYSREKSDLEEELSILFDAAGAVETFPDIFGIVAPHAGYIYSGSTAAKAYKALEGRDFKTVIIISPSHREYFQGVSIFDGDAYSTPLGKLDVDEEMREKMLSQSSLVFEGMNGHRSEHAVEVHLPFLQKINNDFKIVPMVIGDQRRPFVDGLADAINAAWNDDTIVVASSDLSHFHSGKTADKLDGIVESKINDFDFEGLQLSLETNNCEACGGGGIVAMMKAADKLGFKKSKVVARTDSGMVSGSDDEVVGYLSAVIYGRNDG